MSDFGGNGGRWRCVSIRVGCLRSSATLQKWPPTAILLHPSAKNGHGCLRVTKSSLWWQQREFPDVWTSGGLTTCVEKEYTWSINSTTWNDIQTMWQGPPLDLLHQVHEETQHQDYIEACGYRSPTWRVLRALKAIIDVTESSTNKQHHLSHYSNG